MKFDESERFSVREIVELTGVHVRARKGGLAAEGTRGTISGSKHVNREWYIVVDWEDRHQEMFAKKDARKLLKLTSA